MKLKKRMALPCSIIAICSIIVNILYTMNYLTDNIFKIESVALLSCVILSNIKMNTNMKRTPAKENENNNVNEYLSKGLGLLYFCIMLIWLATYIIALILN